MVCHEVIMHAGSLECSRRTLELLEVQARATLVPGVLSKLPKCIHDSDTQKLDNPLRTMSRFYLRIRSVAVS